MGTRSKTLSELALWSFLMLPLSVACGGAGKNAPAASAHEKAAADTDATSEGDDANAEEESAPRSSCEDGTCSACGNGMCPTGWYCDESANGGPACSWLPQCARKSSCACVTAALGSACKCEEQSGGLHVSCK